MDDVLPTELLSPLANAIGDAFTQTELDGLVLRSTGEGLYKEFVPPGHTDRDTAYRLLVSLQEHGMVRLFLAHVLNRRQKNAGLRQLISRACAPALTTELEVRNQVGLVLAGLAITRTQLENSAVKDALERSTSSLTTVSRQIDLLEVYKNLHECVHQLQITTFSDLKSTARQLGKKAPNVKLMRSFQEQLNLSYTKARSWIDRLPPEPPTVRAIELDWIDGLEQATAKYQPALDERDVAKTISALNEVRRIIRQEPFRFSKIINVTAKKLPLESLTTALVSISAALDDKHVELNAACVAVRDLGLTLLGRVAEHKMWQDADNLVWDLEDTFDLATKRAREEFELLWPDTKRTILLLVNHEPEAEWAKNTEKYSELVDDEVAREGAAQQLESSFDTYRHQVRFRFFNVDGQLRADCAALVKISAPIKTILEDLGHAADY